MVGLEVARSVPIKPAVAQGQTMTNDFFEHPTLESADVSIHFRQFKVGA
jgi:hypothetical protein